MLNVIALGFGLPACAVALFLTRIPEAKWPVRPAHPTLSP